MYTTEAAAIRNGKKDGWAKMKGFALVTKEGAFDYVYGGTPLINGEKVLARFVYLNGNWRRYDWDGGRWVRVK